MIELLIEKSNIGKISTNKTVHNLPLSKRERAHFFLNDFFTNKKPKKPLKIIEQCPTRYTLDLNWESVKVKTRIITGPYEARGEGCTGGRARTSVCELQFWYRCFCTRCYAYRKDVKSRLHYFCTWNNFLIFLYQIYVG